MSDKPVLYGFDGSTYVRTVRMVARDKGVDYDQVPLNVLEGEPRQAEHLKRHPFGKVPVLDIDGIRIRETDAICRYLEATRPEPALVPDDPKARARMNEAISVVNAYGYPALVGVAGYHLFPDFIGGQDAAALAKAKEGSVTALNLLMGLRGSDPWIAGADPSLADYFLGPIIFYLSLTPEMDEMKGVEGLTDWWAGMSALPTFKATEPDLG
mgnify:CR=1 FL=1